MCAYTCDLFDSYIKCTCIYMYRQRHRPRRRHRRRHHYGLNQGQQQQQHQENHRLLPKEETAAASNDGPHHNRRRRRRGPSRYRCPCPRLLPLLRRRQDDKGPTRGGCGGGGGVRPLALRDVGQRDYAAADAVGGMVVCGMDRSVDHRLPPQTTNPQRPQPTAL